MPEKSPTQAAHRKLCFVISPIGELETEVRKKSDQVLKHLIKNVLEPEFVVERADQIGRPGIITVQVVQRIFDADLVVADLTDRNPNVYYELAIRHAARKPAIHIISRGQDIPFDVQDMRFVPYDLADPDSLDEARGQLRDGVHAIQQGEPVITPVQIAQILQSLAADEDRNAQIRALFESLNAGMSNLQEGIAEIVQDLRNKKLLESFALGTPGVTLAGSLVNPLGVIPASGFNFPSTTLSFENQAKPDDTGQSKTKLSEKVQEALKRARESGNRPKKPE